MTDAVVVKGVVKHFRKTALRKEFTSIKTELVRLLSGKRKLLEEARHIRALEGIDLAIPKGKTVAIIGRNGSGKSTLLKLITGIYTPTSGTVEVHGRISALLELGAGFHPDFTGRENILINGIILGMSRAEVKARTADILAFAELGDFIDEPVRTYSSGMFMRLAFAVATNVDPEILIIDEILSVGDEHFQKKSQAKMDEFKKAGKTILFVSHSLSQVEAFCDHAVWIDGGTVRMQGEPRSVVSEYRKAIWAAEAEAARTGRSALSAPGVALSEGVAAADAFPTTLTRVRVQDGSGAQPKAFIGDAKLEVLFDYEARRKVACDFTADFHDQQMRLMFRARFSAGELAAGRGTARLTIPRLGLNSGAYSITAWVHPPKDRDAPWPVAKEVFTVAPHPGSQGVMLQLSEWALEPAPASELAAAPVEVSAAPADVGAAPKVA